MGKTLSFFITDDRSAVETFKLLVSEDIAAAKAHAEADLRANPHHHAVEILDGDAVVAVLRRRDLAPEGSMVSNASGPD